MLAAIANRTLTDIENDTTFMQKIVYKQHLLNPAKLSSSVDNVKCNTNKLPRARSITMREIIIAIAKQMASNITKIPLTSIMNCKIPSYCSASSLSKD